MNEQEHMKLALETANEIEKGQKAKGMQATPILDKLSQVLAWLRSQNIPWAMIFAKLPQILAAFASGDITQIIALLISLFGLPSTTPHPVLT